MKTYTFHVPIGVETEKKYLEDTRVVYDGFSWGALSFGVFWFLFKGYFLASLFILLVYAGLYALIYVAGASYAIYPNLLTVFHIFLGLEASTLIRWTYRLKGMEEVDVVLAKDSEEAEVKGLSNWLNLQEKSGTDVLPVEKNSDEKDDPVLKSLWSTPETDEVLTSISFSDNQDKDS